MRYLIKVICSNKEDAEQIHKDLSKNKTYCKSSHAINLNPVEEVCTRCAYRE